MSDRLTTKQLKDRIEKLKGAPDLHAPFAFAQAFDARYHLSIDTRNPGRSSSQLLDCLKRELNAREGAHGLACWANGGLVLSQYTTYSGLGKKALDVVREAGCSKLTIGVDLVTPPAEPNNPIIGAGPAQAAPEGGAGLANRLTALRADFDKARQSPVAGPKLVELWEKAARHIADKQGDKAVTDLVNLERLIAVALKHEALRQSNAVAPPAGPANAIAGDVGAPAPIPPTTGPGSEAQPEAHDRATISRRLREFAKSRQSVAQMIKSAHLPAIDALIRQIIDLAKADAIEQAFVLLEQLERLGDAAIEEAGRRDEYREFQAEVQRQKNAARATRIGKVLDGVTMDKYFPPGMSDRYAKEPLKAGKEFKAFLAVLHYFENRYAFGQVLRRRDSNAQVDPAEFGRDIEAVARRAQDYLDHFDTLSETQKNSPESRRKSEICKDTKKRLRQLRLKAAYAQLGSPEGWALKQQTQAAALYTKLLFEEVDVQFTDKGQIKEIRENQASPLTSGEAGVSGAWWVEAIDLTEKEEKRRKKKFIFKPSDAELEIPGFPREGSAPREVVSKVVADQLQLVTGIDFGFPETVLVAIDDEKLGKPPAESGRDQMDSEPKAAHKGGQRVGSMQHFSKSDGTLKSMAGADRTVLDQIPQAEIQKIALLDLITLNGDRHSGNLLLKGATGTDGAKESRLVPIDHGLTLPSRDGLDARRTKIGAGNTLSDLKASQEKFTPDMVEKIQGIDADALVKAMQDSVDTLTVLYPDEAIDAKVPPENFELTRRSVEFLKQAARELAVDEIFDAYTVNAEEIFDSDPKERDKAFAKAIAEAKGRSAARRELAEIRDSATRSRELVLTIQKLGWAQGLFGETLTNWITMNPKRVMNIYKYKVENPVMRRELDEMLKKLFNSPDTLAQIRCLPLRDGYKLATEKLSAVGQMPDARADAPPMAAKVVDDALREMETEFPGTAPREPDRRWLLATCWLQYKQLGGTREYSRLGGDAELRKPDERLERLRNLAAAQAAVQEIDGLESATLTQTLEQNIALRLEIAAEQKVRVKAPGPRGEIDAALAEATGASHAGKFDEGDKCLQRAERLLSDELLRIENRLGELRRRLRAIYDEIGTLDPSGELRGDFLSRRQEALRLMDAEEIQSCQDAVGRLETDVKAATEAAGRGPGADEAASAPGVLS